MCLFIVMHVLFLYRDKQVIKLSLSYKDNRELGKKENLIIEKIRHVTVTYFRIN